MIDLKDLKLGARLIISLDEHNYLRIINPDFANQSSFGSRILGIHEVICNNVAMDRYCLVLVPTSNNAFMIDTPNIFAWKVNKSVKLLDNIEPYTWKLTNKTYGNWFRTEQVASHCRLM